MDDIFSKIAELRKLGKTFAVATVVKTTGSTPASVGNRIIVFEDKTTEGTVGGGAIEKKVIHDSLDLIKSKESQFIKYDLTKELGMLCGGIVEVFIETFWHDIPRLFIFGGGHIAQKLGPMAHLAGLSYTVIDDREEFTKPSLFPGAENIINAPFEKAFANLPINKNSYIVIVTYKHLHDEICLEKSIATDACYIGMIGSKKKVLEMFENLSRKGFKPQEDVRVHAPIGLNLGDDSPGEIAVSILAEILKIKSGGDGRPLRLNKKK